ncbi:uncharacterized protein PHACADRAFT_246645 [Phanerochaete carnosa HHB-10118-sp]|uniref:Uncharacterized protein n=1 Tax=Phanerochaete carnosa (strain HHB-10118-sp) TaxID=650164 RepID=K5VCE8_PHACS|nr:uncharacterized protein PHACADRAFT_246645 [Phanerochaete carnosa HHB-10118-sp]EKM60606.1 hypothetical protein PHACADRAFT_246645 [Phanerochaete carnosa HHB-10118-sp]
MPLTESLKAWRKDEAVKRYGAGRVRLLGVGLVMTHTILCRIVDSVEKLETTEDIERELTDWEDVHQYSAQILLVLNDYRSSLSPPSTPPVPELEQPYAHGTDATPVPPGVD